MKDLSPAGIASVTLQTSMNKVSMMPFRQLLLGILAGVYIAFASEGSNMAAFNLLNNPATFGLGKALAGSIFGTGMMLVVIAGGELFTGNTLIMIGVLSRKIKISQMLKNWFLVYIGNFIGSIIVAYMIVNSGLLNSGANVLGGVTIRIAEHKTDLPFMSALYLGIMCNWLVCLAIWMSNGAQDMTGKIMAIFFPIWLFIASGFEHSVANMYYVPAGILAKSNPGWAEASLLSADQLARLNWQSFLVNNLIPVTIGNIIGGALFVGGIYWFVYLRKPAAAQPESL